MVGSIYLAKIFFTNGQDYKLRPILIIKKNSFDDYIYIPFATKSNHQYSIKFDNNFLEKGTFNKTSYLILDKVCTIQSKLLVKEIAVVNDNILEQILNKYCQFLNK